MAALLILALCGLIGLNLIAWRQARALCRFDTSGKERTTAPENLTARQKMSLILSGATLPKPRNLWTPEAFGLASQTIHFSSGSGQELEAWYLPGSGKTAVILFHGYAASKSALLPMARILQKQGFPLLLVDFYGSGGSSGDRTSLGYLEAEDVVAAREWLTAHAPAERLILYGISMGGAAIMRACGKLGVLADGLIVESTFPDFRETVAMRFKLMNLPATPGADLLLFWGSLEMGFNPWRHNPAEYARGIAFPVLMMTGARDARVPLESARRMAGQFAGPLRLEVIESGHLPFAETHPDQWRAFVSEFIETL